MILVNHIIAHRQLGKALNLFPFIGSLFSLPFLFLGPEHVSFGNHQKLNLRIFKAPVQLAIGYENFSRLDLSRFLIRTEGPKIIFPKIPCQTAGSGSGAGQKNYSVFFLFPPFQILNQHFKAALVRIHIFYINAVFLFHSHSRKLLFQSSQIHRIRSLCPGQNLLHRIQKLGLSRKQISLFQTMGHTLPKLCLHSLSLFPQSWRLVQKNHTGIRLKIIQKRYSFPSKIRDTAIQSCDFPAFLHSLSQFLHNRLDPMGLFCFHGFSQFFRKSLFFFSKTFRSQKKLFLRQYQLCSRINQNLIQLFNRTLTFQIKGTDRINLRVPQFNPHRNLLCQRENIQNAAANGKLPHTVYLRHSFISQLRQLFLPLFQIQFLPRLCSENLISQLLQRKQMIHKSVQSRYHNTRGILHQMAQG